MHSLGRHKSFVPAHKCCKCAVTLMTLEETELVPEPDKVALAKLGRHGGLGRVEER